MFLHFTHSWSNDLKFSRLLQRHLNASQGLSYASKVQHELMDKCLLGWILRSKGRWSYTKVTPLLKQFSFHTWQVFWCLSYLQLNYCAVKRVRDFQLDTERTTTCGGVSAGDMWEVSNVVQWKGVKFSTWQITSIISNISIFYVCLLLHLTIQVPWFWTDSFSNIDECVAE